MGQKLNSAKHILYIRTDRIGDFLLNLPAIHALKETYPSSKTTILIHPDVEELVCHHPDIDTLIPFSHKSSTLWHWIKLFFTLQKNSYDIAIISNPHKFFHLLTFLLRIPKRIGYQRKWGFLLTHAIQDTKAQNLKHEAEYNLDLVSEIGAYTKNTFYTLPLSQEEEDGAKSWFEKNGLDLKKSIIVINPYTTASFKQWPPHHFIELIKKFSVEGEKGGRLSLHGSALGAQALACAPEDLLFPLLPIQLILIGGLKESYLIKKEILPHLKNYPILDLSGFLSLKQLVALLKNASLLISNDSGPVHIAAAFNTKTITLFGNSETGSHPKRWGPWSLKTSQHTIIQNKNIKNIETEEIWKHIQNHLKSLS